MDINEDFDEVKFRVYYTHSKFYGAPTKKYDPKNLVLLYIRCLSELMYKESYKEYGSNIIYHHLKLLNKQIDEFFNEDCEKPKMLSEERQDVTCSEGEAVTELSQSSGSDFLDKCKEDRNRERIGLPKGWLPKHLRQSVDLYYQSESLISSLDSDQNQKP